MIDERNERVIVTADHSPATAAPVEIDHMGGSEAKGIELFVVKDHWPCRSTIRWAMRMAPSQYMARLVARLWALSYLL